MIRISVNLNSREFLAAVTPVTRPLMNRRGLHAALAGRFRDLLVDHFRAKNATPNKLGGKRTNFWSQMANSTVVTSVAEDGAVVRVAEDRFAIHVHGGTVRPKIARALTIPLIPAAHGLSASMYEDHHHVELFTLRGVPILFQKTEGQGSASTFGSQTGKRKRNGQAQSLSLAPRQRLQAVYALVGSARIPADPDALPSEAQIEAILREKVEDYFMREEGAGTP